MSAYVDVNIVGWMKETVEHDCKLMAMANGLPDHVVDKIETKKVGYMEAEVQNNYQKDGKPIGVYLDLGTSAHVIVGNPLLAFQWLGRSWVLPYVNHPGFEGYHYMEKGKQTGIPRFYDILNDELKNMVNWWKGKL